MPRIGLSETWSLIPEGVHVFKITRTNYDEKFGKLEITSNASASSEKTVNPTRAH